MSPRAVFACHWTDAMSLSEANLFDTAPPAAAARFGAAAIKARLTAAASAALLPVIRRAAGDVGAETLEDAWRVAEKLAALGLNHTLGFWDTPAYAAGEIIDIYLAAIERAQTGPTDGYVSIKPPALRFDADAARTLARAAAAANVRLHCDSHGLNVADLTLTFAGQLLDDLPPGLVSVSLPGRWPRSLGDAEAMIAKGVGVRIVKGQWPDPEDPGRDLRAGFLELVDRTAPGASNLAIASRDLPLVHEAVERLTAAGARCEVEFIRPSQTPALLEIAARTGAPARIYVPYGKGFVPSALGVLRRNPRLALGVIRQMVRPSRR
jgi:proline dehydrogenase